MESPQIYTALNVPTVTSHPSVKCLQWSADGQACFATKTSVYIMTPDHGIHFDTTSAIRSLNEKDTRDGVLPIGWFRTIISFDKMEVHRWPEYSQAWGAASLGSIDVSLWDIALSPSALSPDSGCILAALSSNMDFTLWTASKNCLKGEWIKIFDVTPFLLETYLVDGETLAEKTVRTLKAQVTSIFWSSQVDYSMIPAPTIDGSLLIAGNRAGSIIFLRYRADQTMQIVESLQVAEQWITWITFSSWTLVKPGTCEGFLSYGTSDGSVGLVKVTQSFPDSSDSWDNLQSGLLPTITFDSSIGIICRPDRAGITALTWAEIPHKGRVLVYCKPGVVYIWCPASPNFAWSGHRSFPLKTLKLSTGSSSLHPVSGIQYIRRMDILIITISDGSFHVVHNVTIDPSMEPPNTEQLVTSERLSTAVRAVFTQSGQDVDFSDVNRITGIMPYDGCATFIWIQEASRPADFSYKHDAKHSSMVVVSRTWDDTNNEALLQDLAEVLEGAKIATGFTPLHLLRPFFFTLRDKKRLSDLHVPFLEILKPRTADYSTNITVAPWDSATPESRRAFRASLVQNLFGWDDLLSLRMRLSLADFAWKHSDNEERQNECGNVAQLLLNTISHCVLRTIIRHLAAAVNILTPNDIPFVLRMVVQSLLPGSPADLSAEGNNLSTASQAIVFPHPQITPIANSFNERCPACQVEVPLQDITTAVCSNGHTWARCSITTFILSTPLLRTCVGCSRKAFLPLSTPNSTTRNWLPAAAQGWVVEELLEAVHRCLFCSNSFVNVL